MAAISTGLDQLAPMPEFSEADWPSYLYLLLFVLNTAAICWLDGRWMCAPFVLLQGLFLVGMLELTHQALHKRFVTWEPLNDWLGAHAAALLGLNFTAYRFFHLAHHRHTCDKSDPEGLLFSRSPATRWIWLLAPLAQPVTAYQVNRWAGRFVPASRRKDWLKSNAIMATVIVGLVIWAALSPLSLLLAYVVPYLLYSWLEFLFCQAGHYGAPIRAVDESANVASVSLDMRLPRPLGWLMLNRNLHRVHHVWPRTRWFEANGFLPLLETSQPGRVISLAAFVAQWLSQGPRGWQP